MIRRTLALTTLATLLLTSSAAYADDPARAEARQRFARGLELFNQADNGGALAEFRKAYELVPHPLVLFNLGLVYSVLKRPVEAVEAFDRLLQAPGDLSAERIERAKSERQAQAARVGVLDVRCNADHASVEVDGLPHGSFDRQIKVRVSSGPHLLSVTAPGHLPARRELTIAGGATEVIELRLEASEVRPALLDIGTQLLDVDVRVDGQRVATTPLASAIALSAGKHRVELVRDGYTSVSREVDIAPGATGEMDVELTVKSSELGRGGELALSVSETEAVVYVDGASFGNRTSIRLPPGRHVLRVERSGFHDYERQFEIQRGRTTELQVPLDPTPDFRADYVSTAGTQRTLGWVGVAAGAVIAGGSVGFLVRNQGQISDAETKFDTVADSFENGGPCDKSLGGSDACDTELQLALDDLDRKRSRTKFGWIGVGVGVVVSAVGVVLLATGDDPDRYEPKLEQDPYARARVLPVAWVDDTSAGFGFMGAF